MQERASRSSVEELPTRLTAMASVPQSPQQCEQLVIHYLSTIDPEFVQELIKGFRARLRVELIELAQARDGLERQQDDLVLLESVRFRMHRLRGACAMLGLNELAARAEEAQQAARKAIDTIEQSHTETQVHRSLEALIDAARRIV